MKVNSNIFLLKCQHVFIETNRFYLLKVFENNRSESESSFNGDGDKTESELRRMSLNRNSIAERKRLYENRSKSVQEEKPQSPLPLM